jgi:hypothetical protein
VSTETGQLHDVKDRSCIEECPVDCIYEGDRMLEVAPVFRRVVYLLPVVSAWMVDDAGWAASVAQ